MFQKWIVLICLSFFFQLTNFAEASQAGLVVGFRNDSAEATQTAVVVKSKTNFLGGVLGFLELTEVFKVRSGFIYSQRNFGISNGLAMGDYLFSYFDIPLGVLIKINDFGGFFVGGVFGLNSGSECTFRSDCKPKNTSSSVMGLQLGASFKFAPQQGFEFYFETIPGYIADDIKTTGSIIGSYVIYLD